MDISKYLNAGFSCLFIETTEIKRAVNSIQVREPFIKVAWNVIDGITIGQNQTEEANPIEVLEKAKDLRQTAVILENFDNFIENGTVQQTLLNNYPVYKTNQVCLVMIGIDPKKINPALKELIPVLQFDLPSKDQIANILENLSHDAKVAYLQQVKNAKNVESMFVPTNDIIEACQGMSYEEIENTLALSILEHNEFNIKTILERKRQIIRSTGCMDFMQPEPIENLGGLDNLKDYISKRKEAFEEGSIKPKLRSVLLVGIQGCGKSLASKVIASLFDWPLISLDIGSLKGGLVGDTERNTRNATKTIDAFGKAIVQIEEIEKALAGSTGQNLDSGVSAGLLGHLLTWFQERKSEGILIATANDISRLPPEMLRAGRFDTIFFVDTPNESEIKEIINIMNRKYQSNLSTDSEFCKQLFEEQWTGAEIEQLAKDSHFDTVETAMQNIPLLSKFKKEEMKDIREKAKQFRNANVRERKKLVMSKDKNKAPTGRRFNLH